MYLLKTVNDAYMGRSTPDTAFNGYWFGLVLNVPVNNFSVMLGRSHRFLGITSTFLGGGGKYVLLKDTTRRPVWGLNPRALDPESEMLTTRPPRLQAFNGTI